ncbi:MAG TPA: PH domain-containing protein [Xanthobacteraceae bacterium]|nr:PH domain-containing protein [Xanthobacteraceae bacterium]
MGRLIFSVKPVFIGWITLLVQLPLQLFFTFWAGGFFGAMILSLQLFPKDSRAPFVFFGLLAFFGIPAVAYIGKKLNYARTEYRFFDDHLEFEEGFFSINKKVIKFRDVKEVTLRKGVLQRIYGLGTIYLATLATGSTRGANPFLALGFGNVSASGVSVRDIADPDQAFDKIRGMIDVHNDADR